MTETEHGLKFELMREGARFLTKLKGGVVGRLSFLGMFALPSLAAISFSKSSETRLIVWLFFAISIAFIVAILCYALKHPELSTLEGSEVLVHKQLEAATKEGPVPQPMLEPSTDPSQPLLDQVQQRIAVLPDAATNQPSLREGGTNG